MTVEPPSSDDGERGRLPGKRRPTARTPRWVIVFGVCAVVLVGVFLVVHLAGGMGGMAMHH